MRILDRRFRGIGRIKKAAGTTHARTFERMNEMLTQLYEQGRHDVLIAIRDGQLKPLQVFNVWRIGKMDRLPTADMMKPLAETMRAWANGYDCSKDHREKTLLQAVRCFEQRKPTAKVGDLPTLLEALRTEFQTAGKAVAFNRTRSAVQAFVRSTMKRTHPLYLELGAVEILSVKPKREKHPASVVTVSALADKVDDLRTGWGRVIWALALTGMGPKEFTDGWEIHDADHAVHVYGVKREARDRNVPLVWPERFRGAEASLFNGSEGKWGRDRWYKELLALVTKASAALDIPIQPYDLRRSYANWLEAAGILRTRRRLYRGHTSGEVGDDYEWHEVRAFLQEDAKKLSRYLTKELAGPKTKRGNGAQPQPKDV